jgi:hypothetical protein
MTLPLIAGTAAANASVRPSRSFAEQIARTFISHLRIGQRGHSLEGLHSGVAGPVVSSNWSGYADSPPTTGGSTYTSVSGTWRVPSAKCPASGVALAAFWVGLDGFSDQTVEQDGTIVECVYGFAFYLDWWEMYPTNAIQVENLVSPGDLISASVSFNGSAYVLALTDNTSPADSFTTTQSCGTTACDNASAEWVAEAPENGATGKLEKLANFGTWTLSAAAETYDGTAGNISSGPTVNQIVMQDAAGHVKAMPGALTSGGTAFKDVWKKAS